MLKKVAVTELRRGMYLHKLCGSWSQHPFWRSQFTLNGPAQIRTLLDSGILEVWVDAGKGLDVGDEPHAAPADQAPEAGDNAVLYPSDIDVSLSAAWSPFTYTNRGMRGPLQSLFFIQ